MFSTPPPQRTLPPNAGLHYIVGRSPKGPLPSTGLASYHYVGSTNATFEDGSQFGTVYVQDGQPYAFASVDFKGPTNTTVGLFVEFLTLKRLWQIRSPGVPFEDAGSPSIKVTPSYFVHDVRFQESAFPYADDHTPCAYLSDGCFVSVAGMLAQGDDFERLGVILDLQQPVPADGGTAHVFTIALVFER